MMVIWNWDVLAITNQNIKNNVNIIYYYHKFQQLDRFDDNYYNSWVKHLNKGFPLPREGVNFNNLSG